ncbi:MAG: orotate phosphoribosyltransferase, partial [Armatimonadetes bacterium]|nr:orotate phosphoribosyltransferase [Armatimonadota bacterium]
MEHPAESPVSTTEVLALLEQTGAVCRGHFQLSSGRHSPVYVQCAQVLQYPAHAGRLVAGLLGRVTADRIATVVAPALGGIVLGYELARQLGTRALFVERDAEGRFALRRGFRLAPGERVLVAEDVLTTGGSIQETLAVVRAAGAEVVGIAALVDRSGRGVESDVPVWSLVQLELETYAATDCPLCRAGRPLEKPG